MLNKLDTVSGINPITKVSPVLAVDPVASLIQELDNKPQQYVKGKEYQAQVLSKLGDGTYAVKVKLDNEAKDALIKIDLAKSDVGIAAKPGQTLMLRYLYANPVPTFLSLSTVNIPTGSTTDISATAKFIGNILNQASNDGVSARYEASAIVTQLPNNAQIVAHDLKQAIKTSGLFYESHLNNLVNNNHILSAIKQEPQNQANVQLTSLVSQQLTILENQHISWQGQVWSGQKMDLDVYFKKDNEESKQQQLFAQQEIVQNRPIYSEMTLHLPSLGKVTAKLSLSDGRMRIGLLAEQGQAMSILKDHKQTLAKSIEKNGQQLDALTVSHHE
jgi:Flagellar hook-length control protein FliK